MKKKLLICSVLGCIIVMSSGCVDSDSSTEFKIKKLTQTVEEHYEDLDNTFSEFTKNNDNKIKYNSIRAIRENPDEYIGQIVTIKGHNNIHMPYCYVMTIDLESSTQIHSAIFDNEDYRIPYIDSFAIDRLESKTNIKGQQVSPGLYAKNVIVKGEIKYIDVSSYINGYGRKYKILVIVPHEITYGGLTWNTIK